MKTYSAPLMREAVRSKGLRGLILSSRADVKYYFAESEEAQALFFEAWQFMRLCAYPCVLWAGGQTMIFKSHAKSAAEISENAKLMRAWQLFLNPRSIGDFKVTPLSADEFAERLKAARG